VLKAADFGLSTYFSPGQIFNGIVGSAFYVAPEVLRRRYSFQAGPSLTNYLPAAECNWPLGRLFHPAAVPTATAVIVV